MFIPYGKQNINQADVDAVVDVLKSDFLTQGPQVPAFEKSVAQLVGAQHALAVNSATSALHIACLALGLGKGDLLWTSPITFVASSNCALYCGADVDFVDIDSQTYNMSISALKLKLEQAKKDNKLPKIVVPVHLCGQPCDMAKIYALSQEYGFKIIEDASHAIGGKYQGTYVGAGQYSDITIFSFHPVKIVTTAEGGMALTNDAKLAQKMDLLRSHGVTRNQDLMSKEPEGPWYYQQVDLGFNYRMTELQAALGISQMHRLEQFVAKRHDIAKVYNQILQNLPVVLPYQLPETYSGLHLYVIRLKLDEISKTRKEVFELLREKGIGVNVHYIPVHTQPYYENLGFKQGDFPEAESYYASAISLPMYPDLTQMQIDYIYQTLKEILV
ncbi:UDP-4-amino-4,6-dideoxy-N-acetyl-beta-L-altrosamine transaminase [Acinetobacter johnsonii]|uniref:UDP-4-amino-4, 6-dideoxy-N-acetyl-beta-L-altrosamine transaminase n=1 Tax=Acinetobacter johnsonii TaxID=40214 RepID=A0AAW6RRM1_ACIJO|nr:UDP-4-amino-4,6-dideoxy-N-acetyl-beta-L-altrosamine transaminase [Acinetobacter johnsonii]MDG9787044.1 UDP-4-amino-4,6-dideoxy-N-acetyl-beta-L-altrosamine transaminase [Acinetobacter johnsonii]MDG9798486.1 UDP-4-amino-4,6-dideoxy-N-acetyl-beta-L-altrosamine transaminase [Acinetobacter johnsonii]